MDQLGLDLDLPPLILGNKPHPPSTELLRELSTYRIDVSNGEVYTPKGKRVGFIDSRGYCCVGVRINNITVRVKRSHIVFWAYCGRWPVLEIDHKNRIKTDDRISNIREATPQENNANRSCSIGS